jgi:hypothetical protein
MPFRFRRSVKIFPGIRINLSKRGVSTSFGGRGHSINVGRRGVRSTVGIPGTGISYTTGGSHGGSHSRSAGSTDNCLYSLIFLPIQGAFSLIGVLLQGIGVLAAAALSLGVSAWKSLMSRNAEGSENSTTPQVNSVTGVGLQALPSQAPGDGPGAVTPVTPENTSAPQVAIGDPEAQQGFKLPAGWPLVAGIIASMCCLMIVVMGIGALLIPPAPASAIPAPAAAFTATVAPTLTSTETVTPLPTETLEATASATSSPTVVPSNTPTTYIAPPAPATASGGHPAGTTGQCRDGTYTSAAHSQGACSHHGGLALWWGP